MALRLPKLRLPKKLPRLPKLEVVRAGIRKIDSLKITTVFLRIWLRPDWVEHGDTSLADAPGVYIANYSSWIDNLAFAAFIGQELREAEIPFSLALNQRHANHWWAKLAKKLAPIYWYDAGRSDAEINQKLAEAIRARETILLLPESRPTNTGALLPVNDVVAGIIAATNPPLHPHFLDGLQKSIFAAVRPRQCRTHLFPKLVIHRFQSVHVGLSETVKGRERTQKAATQIYDLLTGMAFMQYDYQRTLFESVITSAKNFGMRHKIAEDSERKPITYRKLLIGSYALGRVISRKLDQDEITVGMMLPNVLGALVTFLALQAYGRTPAILNFTAGNANMLSACKTAGVRTLLTSKRFIKAAEMEDTIIAMAQQGIRIVYLEDLRTQISRWVKLRAVWLSLLGIRGYEKVNSDNPTAFDSDGPAVVLFTSGSEGEPKGVILSHANLMSNMAQLQSRIDFGAADCIFNPLPMFHTSGLTGGVILPLMSGMKMFLYPSPLHYQAIPDLIADVDASVLFATDTFLSGYARYAKPHDLHRLRYVFAGAEKLKDETRRIWADKFGVRVLEGYGVTETAPVLAFNTPMYCKTGTVGKLAPGIAHKLLPVDGINEGGRLLVHGPNIMAGYLLPENPGTLVPPAEGWHDTGDIVAIDDDGFVSILGRAKRFAKIAGEMVSLTAVEQAISELWPEEQHAVLNLPDPRKGEQLVLLTTRENTARETIVSHFRDKGLPELYLPKQVIFTEKMPLLGSGKINYTLAQSLVETPMGIKKATPAA